MGGIDIGLALGRAVSGGWGAYQADQKQKSDDDEKRRRDELEQKRIELEQMLAKVRDDRDTARYEQGRRDDKAQEVSSTLDPWQEVDPGTAAQLQGTPFEGRVSKRTTLPSSTIPGVPDGATQSDPGGDSYSVWTPTVAEMRQQKQRQDTETDRATARQDRLDARAETETDRARARTDRETGRQESFDDWVKREEWQRAHPTAAQAGGKDDPEMPRGVESYLYDLSRRQGTSFESARAEVDRTWNKLVAEHPKVSRVKVNQALRGFFQKEPAATIDPLAGLGIEPNIPTPAAPARAGGPGPNAASVAGAGGGQRPRVVTQSQLAAVAQKNGTTPEQERQRAEAEGFVVR